MKIIFKGFVNSKTKTPVLVPDGEDRFGQMTFKTYKAHEGYKAKRDSGLKRIHPSFSRS